MKTVFRTLTGATASYLDLTNTSSGMDIDVDGNDFAIVQLDFTGTNVSFGTAAITMLISLDGVNYYTFPGTPVSFSSAGVQPLQRITGAYRIRLQVTTADAAAGRVVPIIRLGVET